MMPFKEARSILLERETRAHKFIKTSFRIIKLWTVINVVRFYAPISVSKYNDEDQFHERP